MLQKHLTYNKSAIVLLCKYSAITVTHLNVRTSTNMQTMKIIFFKKLIKRIRAIVLLNVCTDTSQMIFDSLQRKPDIAYLDVLSMIHDLLHFFHERNQPNFTLVVVKFYNGLRNEHYHERIRIL